MPPLSTLPMHVVPPLLVGFVSGWTTRKEIDGWYATIKKPSWTPPNRLFGPVWTCLYIAMGTAHWLVHPFGSSALYGAQLALNFLWSPLFFRFKSPALALVDMVCMLGAIAATGWNFYKINRTAGLLFIPYAAWVSYATALTAWIWRNNDGGVVKPDKKKKKRWGKAA